MSAVRSALQRCEDEELWIEYWTSHPLLYPWHCQTFARRSTDSHLLQQVKHLANPFIASSSVSLGSSAANASITLDASTCIVLQSRGNPTPSPLMILHALAKRKLIAAHLSYSASERVACVHLSTSSAANIAKTVLEEELKKLIEGGGGGGAGGCLWKLIDVPSKSNKNCCLLPCDILQLKGLFVRKIKTKFRDPISALTSILQVFGPVVVLTDDEEDSMTIQFTGNGSAERAAEDAVASIHGLQHYLAVDWMTLYQLKTDLARQSDEDQLAANNVTDDNRAGIAPQHLTHLKVCPYDGCCLDINTKDHQRQYLHHCVLPKPCKWRMQPRHAQYFIHDD